MVKPPEPTSHHNLRKYLILLPLEPFTLDRYTMRHPVFDDDDLFNFSIIWHFLGSDTIAKRFVSTTYGTLPSDSNSLGDWSSKVITIQKYF